MMEEMTIKDGHGRKAVGAALRDALRDAAGSPVATLPRPAGDLIDELYYGDASLGHCILYPIDRLGQGTT
jgi:hypothetical protein